MKYCIVDNNGDVWASDMTLSYAQDKLADITADIGEDRASELELEIIEQ